MQPVQSASQESIDGNCRGNPTENPTDGGENHEQSTEVDEVKWLEQCGVLERYHGKDSIDCSKGDAAGDYAIKNALSDEGRSNGRSGKYGSKFHPSSSDKAIEKYHLFTSLPNSICHMCCFFCK